MILYGRFSMIESGEYPSFTELVNLQQRGIDYEAIYDRSIFFIRFKRLFLHKIIRKW